LFIIRTKAISPWYVVGCVQNALVLSKVVEGESVCSEK
jgi:hypothetical protein